MTACPSDGSTSGSRFAGAINRYPHSAKSALGCGRAIVGGEAVGPLEVRMSTRIGLGLIALVAASVSTLSVAQAADTVKVAIGQIDAWANQMPTLGVKAG